MLRYLALGDSYTIGEGVEEAGRWPLQLASRLREVGITIADPRIIATTGWTTDELAAAMDAAEPLGRWDFVSLLIGVNNQYRGRSVNDYASEFATLLQRATASMKVSLTPFFQTPFCRFLHHHRAGRIGCDARRLETNGTCRW